jgi:hypothetical protein
MKFLTMTAVTTAMVAAFCFSAQAQTVPGANSNGTPNVSSTGPDANAPRADSDANVKKTPAMSGASGATGQMGNGAGFGTPNVSNTGPEANAPRVDSGAAARNSDDGKPPSPGSVLPK